MENKEKVLSFTYDEKITPSKNVLNFFSNIFEKYDLKYYDVIELNIDKKTYHCAVNFAIIELNKKFNPSEFYHKIISKNVPFEN